MASISQFETDYANTYDTDIDYTYGKNVNEFVNGLSYYFHIDSLYDPITSSLNEQQHYRQKKLTLSTVCGTFTTTGD